MRSMRLIYWICGVAGMVAAGSPVVTRGREPSPATQRSHASRPAASAPAELSYDAQGVVRGPRDRKAIALVFTGGDYGEGTPAILDALKARGVRASFFVTGSFLRTPAHADYVRRIIHEGHYLGPHSDGHLLYCAWEDRQRTLVSQDAFTSDLQRNVDDLVAAGMPRERIRFFLPPFEWYNPTIVEWADRMGLVLVNFTSGTRSNADYLPDNHPRFISSQAILQGILDYEAGHKDGMNGFILLLHLGVGPARTDKMHRLFPELLDRLSERGYRFEPLENLLKAVASRPSGRRK